ncbi:uncharacterized protein LOC108667029 [Hyalella azteca]|uniref:Uncharacterized protein LOC108667029 n=1 Tax=Hyalella azteca TaxID=294128 RepID=A0A8B7N7A1_HYAAZ|nr:uncharacterized protein LOC108667029 [Hyalella azteca]
MGTSNLPTTSQNDLDERNHIQLHDSLSPSLLASVGPACLNMRTAPHDAGSYNTSRDKIKQNVLSDESSQNGLKITRRLGQSCSSDETTESRTVISMKMTNEPAEMKGQSFESADDMEPSDKNVQSFRNGDSDLHSNTEDSYKEIIVTHRSSAREEHHTHARGAISLHKNRIQSTNSAFSAENIVHNVSPLSASTRNIPAIFSSSSNLSLNHNDLPNSRALFSRSRVSTSSPNLTTGRGSVNPVSPPNICSGPPSSTSPTLRSDAPASRGSKGFSRVVPSLQETLLVQLVHNLGRAVWKWRDDNPKATRTFITRYRSAVPAHIRRMMLERVLREYRVWHTVSLRLLQLLLSDDCCSGVRVQQVRVFFRDQFISCLTPLTRLTVLRIEDSSWRLQNVQESELCQALSRLQQLQVLSLHYLATDVVLATTVENCHALRVLDLFFCSGVTDRGAQWLLGRPDPAFRHGPQLQPRLRKKKWYAAALRCISTPLRRKRKKVSIQQDVIYDTYCTRTIQSSVPCEASVGRGRSPYPHFSYGEAPAFDLYSCSSDCDDAKFVIENTSKIVLANLTYLDLRGTSVPISTVEAIRKFKPKVRILSLKESLK